MTDLTTLADRVEAGTVEMQGLLIEEAFDALNPEPEWESSAWGPWADRDTEFESKMLAGAYVDAAMMLKLEQLRLMLSEWDDEAHLRPKGPWQAVLSRPGCDASFDAMRGYRCDHAATPALAVAAACLRAHATKDHPHE